MKLWEQALLTIFTCALVLGLRLFLHPSMTGEEFVRYQPWSPAYGRPWLGYAMFAGFWFLVGLVPAYCLVRKLYSPNEVAHPLIMWIPALLCLAFAAEQVPHLAVYIPWAR